MKLTQGVAAGAEDQKYHAKYRDLKKKVKELEAVRTCLCLHSIQILSG
jgi:hypothetical protein